MAGSIRPIQQLGTDPAVIGQSLLLALLFMLLAAFPGQLLNKTVEENYTEVSGWFSAGKGWVAGVGRSLSRFWQSPLGLLMFVVVSALLFGFLSPQFGPSLLVGGQLPGHPRWTGGRYRDVRAAGCSCPAPTFRRLGTPAGPAADHLHCRRVRRSLANCRFPARLPVRARDRFRVRPAAARACRGPWARAHGSIDARGGTGRVAPAAAR